MYIYTYTTVKYVSVDSGACVSVQESVILMMEKVTGSFFGKINRCINFTYTSEKQLHTYNSIIISIIYVLVDSGATVCRAKKQSSA